MTTFFGYLLYLVIAGLAAFLVGEFRLAMRSIRALRWRRVTGQVIQGEADPDTSGAGSHLAVSRINYTYTVENDDYRSDQVAFGFPSKLEGLLARGVVDSLLVAAPDLVVLYDPRKPEESVLIAGYQPFHAWRSGVSLVVLIVLYALAQSLVG